MINKKLLLNILLTLAILVTGFLVPTPIGYAQSDQNWSEPVNLSLSGSASNPVMVIDSNGTFHVIWMDSVEKGYKYSQSRDGGITWSKAQSVKFPFDSSDPSPVLLPGSNGTIHIFWLSSDKNSSDQNSNNKKLLYAKATSGDLAYPGNWILNYPLSNAVTDYDVVADTQGVLHVAFIQSRLLDDNPAGVYYIQSPSAGGYWTDPSPLYQSEYFRALNLKDANIHIALSEHADNKKIYVSWDNRLQKSIYMARSLDGGLRWDNATQVHGAEVSAGIEYPYNIDVTVDGDNVLLIWQLGLPGGSCTQYSQWSSDGGNSFEEPVRMLDKFSSCPNVSEMLLQSGEFTIVSLYSQNEISLLAWNGSRWSNSQLQGEVSAFLNPVTFDNVLPSCQMLTYYNDILYLVNCDEGAGKDVWFSSRPIGSIDEWFPPLTAWTSPIQITSIDKELSELTFAADGKDRIHALWIQSELSGESANQSTIQYAQWNGVSWSKPATVVSGISEAPTQLSVIVDSSDRLLLTWIDEQTGELFFGWAISERAGSASEWTKPVSISTDLQSKSSPDILVDASGRIVIGYAVSINENRGIYLVDSADGGKTWSKSLQILDAASLGWDMIDRPGICLAGDGSLHAIFDTYSYQGSQRRSMGLYYLRSENGMNTWSSPELVSEGSIGWSVIYCTGKQTIHRIWQEKQQSNLLTLHQISEDGGTTWGKIVTVSIVSENYPLTRSTIDADGYLHLLQLTSENNRILINHLKWDGTHWNVQEPKELNIEKYGVPTSFATAIASSGNLLLSTIIDYSNPDTNFRNDIISISRFLELLDNPSSSSSAIIATAEVTSVEAQETMDSLLLPTQLSPLANLTDPTSTLSKKRNIVGILFISGIIVLAVIMIRPRTKKVK